MSPALFIQIEKNSPEQPNSEEWKLSLVTDIDYNKKFPTLFLALSLSLPPYHSDNKSELILNDTQFLLSCQKQSPCFCLSSLIRRDSRRSPLFAVIFQWQFAYDENWKKKDEREKTAKQVKVNISPCFYVMPLTYTFVTSFKIQFFRD